ncbi:MAG: EamA family transporter RarD [Clostridiales bacterium]|nr:EamA family transporter RarD [Clostridiales bacterium]
MEEGKLRTGNPENEYRNGLLCVLACQLMWGFLPIYWQSLVPIPSWIIILYRMTTMFVYSYIAARLRYSREEIWAPLREKSAIGRYLVAGLLLTANWSTYIWAMTTGHMVQSSIGYYIEPIVICLFGIVIFKEKLTKYNLTAIVLAAAALIVMLIHYGQLPGVALGLAFTWASYSALKKSTKNPPIIELVYETMFYALFAVIGILVIETRGIGALSLGVPGKYAMMFLSGLVTLIPIALFGSAAKKVSLFIIGLSQYLSPSITLLLGIFAYKEPIDRVQVISFAVIWIGLIFFTYGEYKNNKDSL